MNVENGRVQQNRKVIGRFRTRRKEFRSLKLAKLAKLDFHLCHMLVKQPLKFMGSPQKGMSAENGPVEQNKKHRTEPSPLQPV